MRSSIIRLKVPNGNVQVVQQSTGANLPTDVICSNSTDTTDCDLFFKDTFASFSTGYYYLKPSSTSNQITPQNLSPNTVYSINANQSIVIYLTLCTVIKIPLDHPKFIKLCIDILPRSCSSIMLNYSI